MKRVMLRQHVVTLTWSVEFSVLNPNEGRECFIELTNVLAVRFTENPVRKALKWGEVYLHDLGC